MTTHHPHSYHFRRPSLHRWAFTNAWKLSILTAVVTLLGVFLAVSLSLVLRPTRPYFFPLLSDVDKHHPERAILRFGFIFATLLLIATTTASVLHSRTLRFFIDHANPPSHFDLHTFDSTRPVDVSFHSSPASPSAWTPGVVNDATVSAITSRRRRLNRTRILIFVPVLLTPWLMLSQYPGLDVVGRVIGRLQLESLGMFVLSVTWLLAMCFLVWYFLKLQTMPDRITSREVDKDEAQGEGIEGDVGEILEVSGTASGGGEAIWLALVKNWTAWGIVVLRPICLTGQVVCIIKIAGLRLALDTFSISRIRLVKKALLAALAFAEYTTAFFFAFFMTILAVDMRAKSGEVGLGTG